MALLISPAMNQRLMDERIREEDIRRVFETEGGVLDPLSGTVVKSGRIGAITLWISLRPAEDGFQLENIYCHRMTVDGVSLCKET